VERQVDALGPTGARVGRRIGELRRKRGLTLKDLAARLAELDKPILLSALSKLEKGQRRVDVDDLVALALALDVSPNSILLSEEARLDVEIGLTPGRAVDAASAWRWATQDSPPQPVKSDVDCFISYAGPDRRWAEWIAWQLEDVGFTTLVAGWDFVPGLNLVAAMEEGIRRAKRVIAVLSQSYVGSAYTTEEWQAAIAADPAGTAPKLLPILVEDCELPPLLRQLVYVDLRHAGAEDARERLLEAVHASRAGRAKPSAAPAFPHQAISARGHSKMPGRAYRS